jgi:hypothetical protein
VFTAQRRVALVEAVTGNVFGNSNTFETLLYQRDFLKGQILGQKVVIGGCTLPQVCIRNCPLDFGQGIALLPLRIIGRILIPKS